MVSWDMDNWARVRVRVVQRCPPEATYMIRDACRIRIQSKNIRKKHIRPSLVRHPHHRRRAISAYILLVQTVFGENSFAPDDLVQQDRFGLTVLRQPPSPRHPGVTWCLFAGSTYFSRFPLRYPSQRQIEFRSVLLSGHRREAAGTG